MEHKKCYKNVFKHREILLAMSKCKKCMRDEIINKADDKLVGCICEMCHNLLNGAVPINVSQKRKLAKYKNTFRELVEEAPLEKKKQILLQSCGFLQFSIRAVVSGIAGIISSAIAKKK